MNNTYYAKQINYNAHNICEHKLRSSTGPGQHKQRSMNHAHYDNGKYNAVVDQKMQYIVIYLFHFHPSDLLGFYIVDFTTTNLPSASYPIEK